MSFEDKNLTCVECNTTFVFSADDQSVPLAEGLHRPQALPGLPLSAASRRRRRRRWRCYGGAREMHPAVCAQCNKDTEVPFRPSGDRPVYCSDCFSKRPAPTNQRW